MLWIKMTSTNSYFNVPRTSWILHLGKCYSDLLVITSLQTKIKADLFALKQIWKKIWSILIGVLPFFLLSQEHLEYPSDLLDPTQKDVGKENGDFLVCLEKWKMSSQRITSFTIIQYVIKTYWWAVWANISKRSWQAWIALKHMETIYKKSSIIQIWYEVKWYTIIYDTPSLRYWTNQPI